MRFKNRSGEEEANYDTMYYLYFDNKDSQVTLTISCDQYWILQYKRKLTQIDHMVTKTVGLTGGIGSGKSYVARIFEKIGVPVYDSDINAKLLMTNKSSVRSKIKSLLGSEAYTNKNEINRAYIAGKVFSNKKLLSGLNQIVHPAVREDFQKFLVKNSDLPYLINEAALFVENGTYEDFDCLITVVSPMEVRIKRIKERDQTSRKDILARMENQSSDSEKIKLSDQVIYNDIVGNLLNQISDIHQELLKK